jgi:hypothetical protein
MIYILLMGIVLMLFGFLTPIYKADKYWCVSPLVFFTCIISMLAGMFLVLIGLVYVMGGYY